MGFLSDAMLVPDPVILPAGTEAQVQVVKASLVATKGKDHETGEEKPVRPMVNVMLRVLNEPNVQLIFHRMIGDLESDSPESREIRARERKAFAKALSIDPASEGDVPMEQFAPGMEEVEIPGWKGKEGWALLGVSSFGGEERNEISRWIVPK